MDERFREAIAHNGGVSGGGFIDCGAYVGDTAEQYIWNKEGVIDWIAEIEPDRLNLSALKARKCRLLQEWHLQDEQIELVQSAVGNKSGKAYLGSTNLNNGLSANLSETSDVNGEEVSVITLDEAFKGRKIGFIKADIESYEFAMLEGAKNIIKTQHPCLAVCIYHNAVDLYSIPMMIHEMYPEYKMAIRHHSYTTAETVLYAWA